MAQGNNRKQKLEDVSHFFRPARSVSGTRRRVTTDELEQFRREHVESWPSASSPLVEAPENDPPAAPAARGSFPSIPTPPSPWLTELPTAPPPPSPWVPAADSIPPAPLVPK